MAAKYCHRSGFKLDVRDIRLLRWTAMMPFIHAFMSADSAGIGWFIPQSLLQTSPEIALYVLPNAVAVRFEQSGTLLDLLHKWTLRTCINAQREIWQASMDEVEQVRAVHPKLAEHIGPPCFVRSGNARPRCTEGSHFCGVPVWRSFPETDRRV